MAVQHGKAGQGARNMAFRRDLVLLAGVIIAFAVVWLWWKNLTNIAGLGLSGVVALMIALKFGLSLLDKKTSHIKKRSNQAVRGAAAEVEIAATLADLPDDHILFHDLNFPGFNVDHVVVGAGGVFLIETKSHRGRITADGNKLLLNGQPTEKDFINQAWNQTYQLADCIKARTGKAYPVKPILCFSKAFVQVRQPVKGVAVINMKMLNELLTRQKSVLSAQEIEEIVSCLKEDRAAS